MPANNTRINRVWVVAVQDFIYRNRTLFRFIFMMHPETDDRKCVRSTNASITLALMTTTSQASSDHSKMRRNERRRKINFNFDQMGKTAPQINTIDTQRSAAHMTMDYGCMDDVCLNIEYA